MIFNCNLAKDPEIDSHSKVSLKYNLLEMFNKKECLVEPVNSVT